MFWMIADKVGRVLAPILIHFLVSNVIGIWFTTGGLHADAAFLTSITAVLVLPLFLWMYKKDCEIQTGSADENRERRSEKRRMRLWDYVFLAVLGTICNMVLTFVLNFVLYHSGLSNEVQEALFGSSFIVQLTGLGIIIPLMEEVLFRGLVYKRLKGYTKNVWAAILGASALFAVYHGNIIQMMFAFPMGILLVILYRKWDSLKAPVTFHAAVNISSVLIAAYTQGLL
ncbi:MAG: type II CAAX endopeptidase family protein [Eubacteriales bacterium]|nr:type II CAAX endopeptidase family protein [Eubacteriales bacterium]